MSMSRLAVGGTRNCEPAEEKSKIIPTSKINGKISEINAAIEKSNASANEKLAARRMRGASSAEKAKMSWRVAQKPNLINKSNRK